MRACESARAGSARSAQAATDRRIMLDLDREGLDIATSKDHRCLLEHGFGSAIVKIGSPVRKLGCPRSSIAWRPVPERTHRGRLSDPGTFWDTATTESGRSNGFRREYRSWPEPWQA